MTGRGSFNTSEVDQHFLRHMVYPFAKNDVLVHSELVCFEGERPEPFPRPRRGLEFVGESLDGDGSTLHEHHLGVLQQHNGQTLLPVPTYRRNLSRLVSRAIGRVHRQPTL